MYVVFAPSLIFKRSENVAFGAGWHLQENVVGIFLARKMLTVLWFSEVMCNSIIKPHNKVFETFFFLRKCFALHSNTVCVLYVVGCPKISLF